MKKLADLLDRLEPWAFFISVVGILFVPFAKPWWWALLFVVAVVRVVRAWIDAWRWFSAETMKDVVVRVVFLVFAVACFFFLHRTAPRFVHDPPDLSSLPGTYRIVADGDKAALLRIARTPDGDFAISVWTSERAEGSADLVGIVPLKRLWSAAGARWNEPVPLGPLHGPLAGPRCRGELVFDARGRPVRVTIRSGGTEIVKGNVQPT